MILRCGRRIGLAFATLLLVPAVAAAEQIPISGGPKEIMITYRAQPADRPAFRNYLQTKQIAMLRKLKSEGVLKGCTILFNPFVQPSTWDAMTVLSFNKFEGTARWQAIEQSMPGGLDAAGGKLAKPYRTYSADLEWDGAAKDAGPVTDHVFYIIPYSYNDAAQYRSYVNGYVVPQTEGWIKEGVLSRYRIFMNRYQVGEPEPWDALFVYEYRNLTEFGKRDTTVNKVRVPLRLDPEWKKLNDIKSTIRSESENTVSGSLAEC